MEDCSSTTTRGRSSSPGSTEMTLGMFHGKQSCCNVPKFYLGGGGASCQREGRDPAGSGQVEFEAMREDYVPHPQLRSLHLSVLSSPLKCVQENS